MKVRNHVITKEDTLNKWLSLSHLERERRFKEKEKLVAIIAHKRTTMKAVLLSLTVITSTLLVLAFANSVNENLQVLAMFAASAAAAFTAYVFFFWNNGEEDLRQIKRMKNFAENFTIPKTAIENTHG